MYTVDLYDVIIDHVLFTHEVYIYNLISCIDM